VNESLIECVPNFSEGRDLSCISAIVEAVSSVSGVMVLDRTSDFDHHRSVITFAGRHEVIVEAAIRAASVAVSSIDLNKHKGIHPRLGALDVLPFIPLGTATLEQCVALAHSAGERIYRELGVPVYFYGAAAKQPERIALENVRRGQFDGLRETALTDPSKAPDVGGPGLHPTAGAVIVGARKVLIAFNVNLRSSDLEIAKNIARRIRASNGGLPFVKALGLPLRSRNLVQVSMNLTDFEQTPLHMVYAEVSRLAGEYGVEIAESELIGLMPRQAIEQAGAYSLRLPVLQSTQVLEQQLSPLLYPRIDLERRFLADERIV
jgi:glutamate formiminotransferase